MRDLAESLREMLGAVDECPDLRNIPGTTNVIDEIGHVCLDIASLIQEYTKNQYLGKCILLSELIR